MQIEILNSTASDKAIVFFNGWGMDSNVINHLKTEHNLICIFDYRELNFAELAYILNRYKNLYVVAWSMGVWAASMVLPEIKIAIRKAIGLNGTEQPVDDKYGIPVKAYILTERGMTEQGREKFFKRMFTDEDKISLFFENLPNRDIAEQREELCLIREQGGGDKNILKWDKIYIAEKDLIFPVNNQINWWQDKAEIETIPGGHYPFYNFKNWEEILDI